MMKKYNSDNHNRQSFRMEGYDYSKPGLYFITISSQKHVCYFGEIENNKMVLNDTGKMVEHWYYEIENKFKDVKCWQMVVMPNHFHCILQNTGMIGKDGSSSLSEVMKWFKTMTTNEYIRGVKEKGWQSFDEKLWQRNYWDHIIRNQKTYDNICDYIHLNPTNWKGDRLYKL